MWSRSVAKTPSACAIRTHSPESFGLPEKRPCWRLPNMRAPCHDGSVEPGVDWRRSASTVATRTMKCLVPPDHPVQVHAVAKLALVESLPGWGQVHRGCTAQPGRRGISRIA